MSKTVSLHQLEDLAKAELKNEILVQTNENTELHITKHGDLTMVKFPFGNNFYVSDGIIYIQDKI
jgi:hypothetical protein